MRRDDGSWLLLEAEAGKLLVIEPLGVTLAVDEVYEDPLARPATNTVHR